MKHVAVLMGGWSAEREISLRSGKACADALERSGYQVSRIDVDRDVAATLRARKPDVALNVLHGRPGEDGTLQGLLEVIGIPYSHSGVLASALAMKKDIAKSVLKSAGVPVPGGMVAARKEAAKRHLLPPPYVMKPVAEGSSMGVRITYVIIGLLPAVMFVTGAIMWWNRVLRRWVVQTRRIAPRPRAKPAPTAFPAEPAAE
jgi:D-alanine-D-alanine ligase